MPVVSNRCGLFGAMLLLAAIGAFVPIVRGRETIGQIEVIAAEAAPASCSGIRSG